MIVSLSYINDLSNKIEGRLMQMKIAIYKPEQQGTGGFDGGKITEQKPIGFPGESSEVKRVGPLFYWAWAKSKKSGYIAAHPHEGFEIITYVTNGKAEHGDSLGTKSTIGPGGIQVMQTGSGVHHEEGFIGPNFEGFQIWFEPFLNEAIKKKPTYHQYHHEDFPLKELEGSLVKTVIGENSPVKLVTDVLMWDVVIKAEKTYDINIMANRSLAALAISGDGIWEMNGEEPTVIHHKDFVVMDSEDEVSTTIRAVNELRLLIIEVPTEVPYRLYPK